jgi:hypothetical protein
MYIGLNTVRGLTFFREILEDTEILKIIICSGTLPKRKYECVQYTR